MTTLAALLLEQLVDIYNINRYNYQLLHATITMEGHEYGSFKAMDVNGYG